MNRAGRGLRGQLLGSFMLTDAGVPLRQPGRKLRAFIALLAARQGPVGRHELVEYLWPEGQLVQLRQLLPKVRLWLGKPDALNSTPLEVWLDLSTDADDFQGLVDMEDYADALALWPVVRRGARQSQFLADLIPPTRLYQDWLEDERAFFNALREEALLALGLQFERSGNNAGALDVYRDLLTLDKLAEEAQRGVMRIALRTGRAEQGLRQYEAFLQKLRREFKGRVQPSPETIRLASELRHAASADPRV